MDMTVDVEEAVVDLVEDAEEEEVEDVEVEGKKTITIHSRILYELFLTPISIYFITAITITEAEDVEDAMVEEVEDVEDAMVEEEAE